MKTVNKKSRGGYVKIRQNRLLKCLQETKAHYILIKVSKQQEDTTIIVICLPNNRAPKYMKQKQNLRVKYSIIIVEDFNTPLSIMDRKPDRR